MRTQRKKVVVLGGGTGTATVIRALRKYPVSLSAIPSMADDGGSTGILRRELGVLPAGDVRQCLIALADNPKEAKQLLGHRFTEGTLKGHNTGNIILAALEREFDSFEEAIARCSRLFSLRGTIHPSTLTPVTLIARDGRQTIAGQSVIHTRNLTGRVTLTLEPRPRANPKAVEAILAADVLVFAPGDWFSSLLPNFLIPDIRKAINASEAVKIHICNLMTSKKHTYGWSVRTFRKQLEKALHGSVDYTVYNTKFPKSARAKSSFDDNWSFVEIDKNLDKCYIQGELLCDTLVQKSRGDMLARNPVRHDEHVLGNIIMRLVEHHHD